MNAATKCLVPYITAREGEEGDSFLSLRAAVDDDGVARLGYWDECTEDRDVRGVLWGRVTQSIGPDGWRPASRSGA